MEHELWSRRPTREKTDLATGAFPGGVYRLAEERVLQPRPFTITIYIVQLLSEGSTILFTGKKQHDSGN